MIFNIYKKYCIVYTLLYITFGGIRHTVYGAKFFGHLNSSLVDNNSVITVKMRLKPSPKQPITKGIDSLFIFIFTSKGIVYFVFNKNV